MSIMVLWVVAGAWLAVGVVAALVMGRRGHDPFPWWLLGTVLGPLVVPVAVAAARRPPAPARRVRYGAPGSGPVDVVVGVDGSTQASAALAAVLRLLGGQLGRLTLAAVTEADDSEEERREEAAAGAALERAAGLVGEATGGPGGQRGGLPELMLLRGRPAKELERLAAEGGYDLVVVGARGTGLSTVLLGSTATALTANAKVPVLVAGGGGSG